MEDSNQTAIQEPGVALSEVIDRLKRIIANDLDIAIKAEDIDETAPLLEQGLELDSILLVELIGLIENEFGIEFTESHLRVEAFQSVRVLAEQILSLVAQPG